MKDKIDSYINKNYDLIIYHCTKLTKDKKKAEEFFHTKICQFYEHKNFNNLSLETDIDILKYIKRILSNEFYSKNSDWNRKKRIDKTIIKESFNDEIMLQESNELSTDEKEKLYCKMFDIINKECLDDKKKFFYSYLLKEKIDYGKTMRQVAKELQCSESTIYYDFRKIVEILKKKMFIII